MEEIDCLALTDWLVGVQPLVLAGDRAPSLKLAHVLYERVALVHRDGDDVAVTLEQLLDARLRQRQSVQVADKDARVDRLRTVRVREVAHLTHRRATLRCNETMKIDSYDLGG